MPDYQQGKIYKIISPHTDKIYIGSTIKQYLSQRLAKHKSGFKAWKLGKENKVNSYDLIELGDVEILLLEIYPCNSKDELISRERYWYDLNKELAVNKNRPHITYEEDLKFKREHYIKNKEHYLKQAETYRELNQDAIKKNSDEWYQKNKNRIKEKNSIIHKCECGLEYTNQNKSRHMKTKIHLNLLTN
jgi:hypothetical protein